MTPLLLSFFNMSICNRDVPTLNVKLLNIHDVGNFPQIISISNEIVNLLLKENQQVLCLSVGAAKI